MVSPWSFRWFLKIGATGRGALSASFAGVAVFERIGLLDRFLLLSGAGGKFIHGIEMGCISKTSGQVVLLKFSEDV